MLMINCERPKLLLSSSLLFASRSSLSPVVLFTVGPDPYNKCIKTYVSDNNITTN